MTHDRTVWCAALAMLAGSFAAQRAAGVILIADDAPAKAIPALNDSLGLTWTALGDAFDDSAWKTGQQAVGYSGPNDEFYFAFTRLFLLAEMHSITPSAFIRIPFDAANVQQITSLTLRMRNDDGFIAYLNGVEAARFGIAAGVEPHWDSVADSYPDNLAIIYNDHDLTGFIDLLNEGPNLLAIHGLNNASTSQDFFIQAELVAGVIPEPIILVTMAAGIAALGKRGQPSREWRV